MRKLLLISLLLAPLVIHAAPACLSSYTLATITAQGFTCQDQDKIYSGFAVTVGAMPTDTVVQIGHTTLGSNDYHNVVFSSSIGFSTVFSVGYVINVDTVLSPSLRIIAAGLDITVPTLSPGSSSVAETVGAFGTLHATRGVTDPPLPTDGVTLNVLNAFSPNSGYATSFTDTFIQGSVPEPVSVVLVGLGLVGIGLLRRRK